jgi:two-component system phosphate regulon sensor histidine kinase PhoR
MRQNRSLLLSAILGVLAVYGIAEGSVPFLAAVIVALILVSIVTPHQPASRYVATAPAAPVATGFDRLSAESLAAAVTDPLVVFDAKGIVAHANQTAMSAFGDVGPGISLPLKFRAPEMQELIEALLSRQAASRTVDYAERVPIERVYRVTGSAVGRGTGLYVLVFKDQSEARRIDRMRADFIANASHELRTPLASIAGFVETLRGPARNDEAARERFLQIMHSQTGRMARLIDDLLSLSRLEMKSGIVAGSRLDLAPLLKAVVDSLKPLAEETGVAIEARVPDGRLEVAGDRDELYQVFENLLENACKYGQSGGKVDLTIDTTGTEVQVAIRDFGPGIAAEHIPRITERFYRVDVESSRSQKGTGLGLAIVKHILTRHGGRLSVRSKVGEGSTFTVHLPKV